MPSELERQAKALEECARHLKNVALAMAHLNENLVRFANLFEEHSKEGDNATE